MRPTNGAGLELAMAGQGLVSGPPVEPEPEVFPSEARPDEAPVDVPTSAPADEPKE